MVLRAMGSTGAHRLHQFVRLRALFAHSDFSRNILDLIGRVDRYRLFSQRQVLWEGPLSNRWSRVSCTRCRRRTWRSFSRCDELGPILARILRDTGRKLRG